MKDSFKKDDVQYKEFLKDMGLVIVNCFYQSSLCRVSNFAFVFKNEFPFEKAIFTRNITTIGG